jgi:lipid II:glycine glycyltransferase (peptidoglycan interpeptide bridge formation enzyme)
MDSRQDYLEKLKLKLDEWNAKIDELEVQAKLAEMENREKYESELARLKKQRDELIDRIDKMRDSGEKAFEELRAGAEQAWDSLAEAYKRAREQFK